MSEATTTAPVTYHWIATVQTERGRIETNDGPVDAIPGVHTHTSTYRAVLANLTEKYGPDFGLLFFALEADQL
ncbi:MULTISPECIES: hypothetical protein [Streptomyces]|uniref:Uncharacterized protein n=1 Tax=Streptomyces dengpaensis TaxID=2049881 RepID=A0ABN5I9W0_9ACTN|nr:MULTISPECIES: hypothetical protein [Streptomyces]AVH59975.1 hypothetical protein C4B68_34050 [Streptomyces dengpaensis]PIB09612.1 hypothetical protein B1C81_10725 [Streptomyces sp. HG99]